MLIERWRKEYNHIRPHSALGYKPPVPKTLAPFLQAYEATPLHPVKRLVFSLLVCPFVFLLICKETGGPDWLTDFLAVLLIFEIFGFIVVWTVYLVTRLIVKGFSGNKPKNEQANNQIETPGGNR